MSKAPEPAGYAQPPPPPGYGAPPPAYPQAQPGMHGKAFIFITSGQGVTRIMMLLSLLSSNDP